MYILKSNAFSLGISISSHIWNTNTLQKYFSSNLQEALQSLHCASLPKATVTWEKKKKTKTQKTNTVSCDLRQKNLTEILLHDALRGHCMQTSIGECKVVISFDEGQPRELISPGFWRLRLPQSHTLLHGRRPSVSLNSKTHPWIYRKSSHPLT